jgi:hypothetical protein
MIVPTDLDAKSDKQVGDDWWDGESGVSTTSSSPDVLNAKWGTFEEQLGLESQSYTFRNEA